MGEDHGIVIHMFENKYGGNEPLKVGLIENQETQNANKKKSVQLRGFKLSLKGVKLRINKA